LGGEERLDAGGDETAFDAAGQVVGDPLRPSVEVGIGGPGQRGVDHHDLARQVRAGPVDPFLRAHGVGLATLDHRRQPRQRLEGGRPTRAVRRDPDVALEVTNSLLGPVAEQPVNATHFEAEVEQTLLQRHHVVTRDHVPSDMGQQSVPEPPAGLVENPVRRGADHAVDGQAALLLERAHGTVEVLVEPVALALFDEVESGQTRPDLRDSVAVVPQPVCGRLGAYVGHAAS